MKKISLYANGELAFEFDGDVSIDEQKSSFLDKMDDDMARGIKIHGEMILNPDIKQRAMFVTMNMIRALKQDNEAIVNVSKTYLADRMPLLLEIRASDVDGVLDIEFVEQQ